MNKNQAVEELVAGQVCSGALVDGLRVNRPSASRALQLGFLLCVLQALDGVLTSLGVSRFGLHAEANPFIRSLMEQLGHVTALGLVKLAAILVIIALTLFARRLPWVNNAMGAIGCIYFFAAIIPWTYILFVKPYF